MDGDGRAGADARAVMRDGCATVRRSETRAMKRSACAEVERTRRRARARRDVWDTFARAESRLAETRLGRNGTVADVHERASRIAYILSETTIDRRRRTARRCVGEDYKASERALAKSDRREK